MKKKIVILICMIAILFSLIVLLYDKENNVVDNKYNSQNYSNALSIMVYDDASKDYLQQDDVPIGDYKINEEKTYCINGSLITNYDNSLGQLKYSFPAVDQCYIYFDVLEMHISPQTTLSDGIIALSGKTNSANTYRVANQNGYRYEGIEPNNYLYFNCSDTSDTSTCEKWRMIGTFEGSTIGLTAGKYYTKIITNDSIGNIAWDTNSSTDWATSTLNTYLNGTYYSSIASSYRALIKSANWRWYMLGLLGLTGDTSPNTSSIYASERSDASHSVEKYIGLFYFSDYMYAMYAGNANNNCNNETSQIHEYKSNSDENYHCYRYDWLAADYSCWSMNPSTAYDVIFHYETSVMSFTSAYDGTNTSIGVRPSAYLEYTVKVTGGLGTFEEPYTIS